MADLAELAEAGPRTPVRVFLDPTEPFTAAYSLAYLPIMTEAISHGQPHQPAKASLPLGGHCLRLPVRLPQMIIL